MLHSLYAQISIFILMLSCGLAIWKGQDAERAGAILILATWVVTLLGAYGAQRANLPAGIFLISDGILAGGLLILALRYSSFWMGAAMLLQAASLSFHAAYFAADRSDLSHATLNLYVLGKNLSSVAMLLVLVAATVAGILKRNRARAVERAAAISAAVG